MSGKLWNPTTNIWIGFLYTHSRAVWQPGLSGPLSHFGDLVFTGKCSFWAAPGFYFFWRISLRQGKSCLGLSWVLWSKARPKSFMTTEIESLHLSTKVRGGGSLSINPGHPFLKKTLYMNLLRNLGPNIPCTTMKIAFCLRFSGTQHGNCISSVLLKGVSIWEIKQGSLRFTRGRDRTSHWIF